MATNRNTATPNPHAPGGWTFTRPVDPVEQDHIVTVTPCKLGMRKKLVNGYVAAKEFVREAIREGHAIAGVRIQIGDCETKWMVYLADNDRLVPCAREEVQGFNALCERLGL